MAGWRLSSIKPWRICHPICINLPIRNIFNHRRTDFFYRSQKTGSGLRKHVWKNQWGWVFIPFIPLACTIRPQRESHALQHRGRKASLTTRGSNFLTKQGVSHWLAKQRYKSCSACGASPQWASWVARLVYFASVQAIRSNPTVCRLRTCTDCPQSSQSMHHSTLWLFDVAMDNPLLNRWIMDNHGTSS